MEMFPATFLEHMVVLVCLLGILGCCCLPPRFYLIDLPSWSVAVLGGRKHLHAGITAMLNQGCERQQHHSHISGRKSQKSLTNEMADNITTIQANKATMFNHQGGRQPHQ
jgi:hypothetical protein